MLLTMRERRTLGDPFVCQELSHFSEQVKKNFSEGFDLLASEGMNDHDCVDFSFDS